MIGKKEKDKSKIISMIAEILKNDVSILGNRDAMLSALEDAKKINPGLSRDIASIIAAIKIQGVGEKFFTANLADDETRDKTKAEVLDMMIKTGMNEDKARFVVDVVVGALKWDEQKNAPEVDVLFDEEDEFEEETAEEESGKEQSEKIGSWVCSCGQTNTANFCVACGQKRPLQGAWTCRCGQVNTGAFCVSCGTSRDMAESTESTVQYSASEQPQNNINEAIKTPVEQNNDNQPIKPVPDVQPPAEENNVRVEGENPDENSSKKKIIMAVGGVALIAVAAIALNSSPKPSPAENSNGVPTARQEQTSKPQQQAQSQKPSAKNEKVTLKSDLSLGGVEIDMTVDDMRRILGQEKSKEKRNDGLTNYHYNGLEVYCNEQGRINALVSDGKSATTRRGLHEGSTWQEMIDTYGKDFKTMDTGDFVLYEYAYDSIKDREGLLRFAIKKSNSTVDYISVRIPQAPNVDTQGAINTIVNYHKNITNKKYRAAYNLATNEMQNRLGLYDRWSGGFRTTISSEATDIKVASAEPDRVELQFILVAKDKSGNGTVTQKFRSAATIVLTGSGWRIAAMSNDKI